MTAVARWPIVIACVAAAACGRVDFGAVSARDAPAMAHDTAADVELGDGAPTGLLLHFAFDSSAGLLDDSAPAHHTATCAACPTLVAGKVGAGAASFAGAQCITITDAADLHPPAFTFALWIDATAAQRSTVFSRPQNGATDTTNTLEAYVDVMTDGNIGVSSQYVSLGVVSIGAWHHLAGAYDGATLTGYLDGMAIGTTTPTPPVYMPADQFLIGCDVNIGNEEELFSGPIDDVRLYDHALDAAEIAALAAL